jgi:G3E family GTPase
LIDALEQLRPRLAHLDGIIVETSGLADPVPVAQTFLVDRERGESYDLDGVITLVDALHAGAILETEPEAVSQVAFADRLVLTKCDLVPRHRIEALKTKLLTLNPTAPFLEVDHGHLDCTAVMDLGAFDMAKADMTDVLLRSHSHAAEVQSLSLFADRPLDMEQFLSWMQQVMVTAGQNILRTKGIIDLVGETRRFVFQGVQTVVDGDAQDPWPSGVRESRMVIIGRDLRFEELRDGWVACIAKTNSDMM